MEYLVLDPATGPNATHTNDHIARFLEDHLDQFGDKKEDILKCLAYAFDQRRGGFVVLAVEDGAILGAVVVNLTGMDGYIPENILVYIAVDRNQRGRGLGKGLMGKAIEKAKGSIALHVEPDNPAKKLYEALGFTNKYLEMRLLR
ncbi:MAG TPA: GNAT family N-acetyltransferase [Flavobacteriales bacterium]|nr:GNAT family N-acetyltransferase [Flavobacteriales bacterium]HQV76458.1 GNAT family N-acetyltransferase [Flavobacteriales bacterium]HQW39857.1 GNAT family N-acetyltransferase [Flavobacteriales bacterium]